MTHTFASATILLLLITDPLGNIPVFVNSLRAVAPHRRAQVIVREVFIAFSILLTFMFVGESFLRVMNLSELALQIGGGVILFLIALRMVFHHPDGIFGDPPGAEPFLVPLAVPSIAGIVVALVVLCVGMFLVQATAPAYVFALGIAMVGVVVVVVVGAAW